MIVKRKTYFVKGRIMLPFLILALIVVFISQGCSVPLLKSSGPYKDHDTHRNGFRYYLPKDIIKVTATITTQKNVQVNEELELKESHSVIKRETLVLLETVPDQSLFYTLDMVPAGTAENKLNVEVTDKGLLKSINLDQVGKTGDIIKNVAKVSGTVLALPISLAEVDGKTAENVFNKTTVGQKLLNQKKSASEKQLKTAEDIYEYELSKFKDQPLEILYFLDNSKKAREMWDRLRLIENQLVKRRKELQKARDSLIAAHGAPTLKKYKGIVTTLTDIIEKLLSEYNTTSSQFNTSFEGFIRAKGIGTPVESARTYTGLFELTELPTPEFFITVVGKEKDIVQKLLDGKPEFKNVARFFKETNIVVAIGSNQQTGTVPLRPNHDGKEARIYYRRPSQVVINIYGTVSVPKADNSGTKTQMNPVLHMLEGKIEHVMSPEAPPAYMAFKSRAFGRQQLKITFNSKGTPMILEQSATASLADATQAVQEATQAAINQVGTTITSIAGIRKSLYAAEIDKLDHQLNTLKKQKETVDAQVQLAGANATQEILVKQTQLNAELELTQKQLELAKAQATYDPDLEKAILDKQTELLQSKSTFDKASTTYDFNLEAYQLAQRQALLEARLSFQSAEKTFENKLQIEILKQKIEKLTQELLLLKKKKEFNQ